METLGLPELLSSQRFLNWVAPSYSYKGETYTNHIANEKHYSIAEVAKQWGISEDLTRDTFRDEPGVLKFERPGTKFKRNYSTMRIPESVMIRVHTKLTAK